MPTSSRRPALRLNHRRVSPEDILLQATIHLSENRPEKAVKLYTEVLYKLSPASICALLNRSLAYSCLQLPELAVVDAYRAGIVANQMRDDEDNGLITYQAAAKYLRTEELHVSNAEAWTTLKRRFVRDTWTHTPLSSLVINDIPQFRNTGQRNEKEEKGSRECGRFSVSRRKVVCEALEIRALYRLCGALYQCGGGARSDALGLIDDAGRSCGGMESWEWAIFQELGNLILSEVMQPWDDGLSDLQGFVSISKLMRQKQEEEKQRTKESMRRKTTAMKLSDYHWDTYEPELDDRDWQKLLHSWVLKSSSNCTPYVVENGDWVDDIWNEKVAPYAELRAERDINTGELVLSEQTASNVTTSIPEDVFEDESPSTLRRFHCDTCASLLIVPDEFSVRYKGTKAPLPAPSPPKSVASDNSGNAAYGSRTPSPERDNPVLSQQEDIFMLPVPTKSGSLADPPPRPSLRPEPLPPYADFMFCCPTHDVPTCSPLCRKSREPFDPGLCHTSIERDLRNSHLHSPSTSIPFHDRKRRCLIDLLFLRLFAKAFNTRTHPLHDSDLVFATCGSNHQGAADEERNWSFMDNVVRPISLLERFFENSQTDQFAQLEKCDGWIINTLLSKISTAMRVTFSPRYVKIFNRDSNLTATYTPFDEAWPHAIHNDGAAAEGKDSHPHIASIHPLFNLIRIADPKKGEKPNVIPVWREGVSLYAVSSNGAEPAIRRGEALLRGADDDGEVVGKGGGGGVGQGDGGGGKARGTMGGRDDANGSESESVVDWEGEGMERDSDEGGMEREEQVSEEAGDVMDVDF